MLDAWALELKDLDYRDVFALDRSGRTSSQSNKMHALANHFNDMGVEVLWVGEMVQPFVQGRRYKLGGPFLVDEFVKQIDKRHCPPRSVHVYSDGEFYLDTRPRMPFRWTWHLSNGYSVENLKRLGVGEIKQVDRDF